MEYKKDFLNNIKNIHFVGIGGSGMCPMAEILFAKGYNITGSDNYESDTYKRLNCLGYNINLGHKAENIKDADLVVYSAAIKEDNPELLEARKKDIPTLNRAQMLGILTGEYQSLIAVSGTHGKTTTTAMISHLLISCGLDPTVMIGGKMQLINGNSRIGASQNFVCEACEYVNSFLELSPSIGVITNIEEDHLDFFKDLEDIINSFTHFAKNTKDILVINGDDENIKKVTKNINIPIITFGIKENNLYRAKNITYQKGIAKSFDVYKKDEYLVTLELCVPGEHNLYNALAAFAVAHYLKVPCTEIKNSLKEFNGAHRRFEVLYNKNDILVVDDFAHHPTEIKTTLKAATQMGFNKVIAIFQPHTYSRTKLFLKEFADALSLADTVIVSEILAVREKNTYGIYAEDLQKEIKNSIYMPTLEEIAEYIIKNIKPGELVITMGGGNVYECANMVVEGLAKL